MGTDTIRLDKHSASFQRFIEGCLGELHALVCIPYLDDIIVFSKTFKEHVEHVRQVFQRLQNHGVKLKPGKCRSSQREGTIWSRKPLKLLRS